MITDHTMKGRYSLGFIDAQSELERMLSNLQEEVGDADIVNQYSNKSFSSMERKSERKSDSKAGKAHILVVDDDIRVLKMMQEILRVDYNVSVASNGRIALRFLEGHKTDLILLDYLMPGMNGKEVLEEIRANPLFFNTPVFFLTGVSDRNTVEKCLKLRPKGYMLKPVKRNELLAKLNTILN